jgi:hypothetical protein
MKLSGQFFDLIVMSHWLGKVWIRIRDISVVLPLFLYRVENRVCLFCGVQVAGAAWRAATRIVIGVGDLVQRTGMVSQVGYWWPGDREVGWRCVRSAPCKWRWWARIFWLNLKTKIDGLWVVWPQNHSDSFLRFSFKINGTGFPV